MLAACFTTTFGEMKSVAAMAVLDLPWASSSSTSRSRGGLREGVAVPAGGQQAGDLGVEHSGRHRRPG